MTERAPDLYDLSLEPPRFDGATIDPERDTGRLFAQLERVKAFMGDGQWHTLAEISAGVGDAQPSVSARLRDLRKARFGAHNIERRYVSRGLWKYRLVKPGRTSGRALAGLIAFP